MADWNEFYVLHVEVPITGDIVTSSDQIAKLQPHVEALRKAMPKGSELAQKRRRRRVDEELFGATHDVAREAAE